jgi:hypothetical protein
MLQRVFHAWERRLAGAATDRVVLPFDWGLDWLPVNGHPPGTPPDRILSAWVETIMQDTQAFYHAPPTDRYRLDGDLLAFPSAYPTPHPENNTVYGRYVPARAGRSRAIRGRRAVLVLPQWNADGEGHLALCRLLARVGISALRLSLPYHDRRMPPELRRADYIVSANLARTILVCRQAVLDARRAIDWLVAKGYERIGILGTSLGSCLAMLTAAHDSRIRVAAWNHVSPYFADVVWQGISTAHVRAGLEPAIDLERLRDLWRPISPYWFLERVRDRKMLLVYARYDLTFPLDLAQQLLRELRAREIPHEVAALPCGHYSTAIAPFSWTDAWILTRFLTRNL